MEKILTIIIPTYNMEKYLCKCLNSLIVSEENMNCLEVLVINDGSKDSSSQIAHEYEKKYPQTFKVIDKKNGNYGSCINCGITAAMGKYIKILDADDWYDTYELAEFIQILNKGLDVDVVFTKHRLCYNDGKIKEPVINIKDSGEIMLLDDFGTEPLDESLLCMHSMAYKTEHIRKIGFYQQEGISYTDIEYCYFPLSYAKTAICMDLCLYNYYIGREGQSISIASRIKHYDDFYLVCKRLVIDFTNRYGVLSRSKKKNLGRIILNPLYCLYLIPLVQCKKKDNAQFCMLLEMEQYINKNDSLAYLRNHMTYRKIPFYLIWKVFHFRIGCWFGV